MKLYQGILDATAFAICVACPIYLIMFLLFLSQGWFKGDDTNVQPVRKPDCVPALRLQDLAGKGKPHDLPTVLKELQRSSD